MKTTKTLLLVSCMIYGPVYSGELPELISTQEASEPTPPVVQKAVKPAKRVVRDQEKLARKYQRKLRAEEQQLSKKERKNLKKKWKEYRLKRLKEDQARGKYAELYNSPAWPFKAWGFNNKALFNIGFKHNNATKAFSKHGGRMDLAAHLFGTNCFKLKDILPEITLRTAGSLAQFPMTLTSDDFLVFLQNTEFKLEAGITSWQFDFQFARFAYQNDITLGMSIPLKHTQRDLEIESTVPQSAFNFMTFSTPVAGTLFRTQYAGDFDLFFADFLKRRNLEYRPHDSQFGFGDIQIFAHVNFNSHRWDALKVGASAQLPSGKKRSPCTLCGPENGTGIPSLSFFASLLANLDYKVNPHFFAQFTYHIPTKLQRRMPQVISFDGKTENNAASSQRTAGGINTSDFFTFGELVAFQQDKPFSIETGLCPKKFSANVERVRISRGIAMELQIGNVFEKFIVRRGALDVFYHLLFSQRERISCKNKLLTEGTAISSHEIGAEYSYQFNESSRLRVGVMYVVAGRNRPETLQFSLSLSTDF